VIGRLDDDKLRLEEVHRFPNGPVRVGDSLYWDVLHLWSEIQKGLALASQACGGRLSSVGLDTWGVDYGLLDRNDVLLGNPYHYRDSRTNGMLEAAFQIVPRAEIYRQTGIQFMQLNSLYQLLSMALAGSPALAAARTFLNLPDLFNFWLTGRKASEFTIASTTQCYDPCAGDWARPLLERLGLPAGIFQPILAPGAVLETIRPGLADEIGCGPAKVIASSSHDTASAVAAVPASGPDYIYLSSGTWSLMGIEIPEPIISAQTLEYNFTNEGGVGGTIRFLKNIMGLWLVQECRREWAKEGQAYSYDEITRMAGEATAFGPLIPVSNPLFLAPDDMPTRIQAFCQKSGQRVPVERGEIVRCALESLALEYRQVADRVDSLRGRRHPVIHIIGGGSQNTLLNQFTADATGRTVIAGPVEATATGNILVQAMALGVLPSLAEGRALVRRSFDVKVFEPQHTPAWDEAYERYQRLQ
jgi:rhamnulokinase